MSQTARWRGWALSIIRRWVSTVRLGVFVPEGAPTWYKYFVGAPSGAISNERAAMASGAGYLDRGVSPGNMALRRGRHSESVSNIFADGLHLPP